MRLREADLTWHVAGDEVVVLDLEGSLYLKLNGSGRLLWEALAATSSPEALATLLVDEYGIDHELARRDVDAFVADLQRRNLIEE